MEANYGLLFDFLMSIDGLRERLMAFLDDYQEEMQVESDGSQMSSKVRIPDVERSVNESVCGSQTNPGALSQRTTATLCSRVPDTILGHLAGPLPVVTLENREIIGGVPDLSSSSSFQCQSPVIHDPEVPQFDSLCTRIELRPQTARSRQRALRHIRYTFVKLSRPSLAYA